MSDWSVTEVDARFMPPPKAGKWWELYKEVMLRLEQTPERAALRIELTNGDAASGAMGAIARLASERDGEGVLTMSAVTEDDKQVLYVRRGHNWTK